MSLKTCQSFNNLIWVDAGTHSLMTVSLTMDLFIVNLIIIILFLFIFGGLRWCVNAGFRFAFAMLPSCKVALWEKLKRAHCSEPVKSGLPAYYDLYEKTTIFSTLESKSQGHCPLLEHSSTQQLLKMQVCTWEQISTAQK